MIQRNGKPLTVNAAHLSFESSFKLHRDAYVLRYGPISSVPYCSLVDELEIWLHERHLEYYLMHNSQDDIWGFILGNPEALKEEDYVYLRLKWCE